MSGVSVLMYTTECPQPYFHSFVLTDQLGERCFGHCVTRFVPLSEQRLAVVKLQVAARLMSGSDVGCVRVSQLGVIRLGGMCGRSLAYACAEINPLYVVC
jgi:hypothetical protein